MTLLMFVATPALALQLQLDRPTLCAKADRVVVATILKSEPRFTLDGASIERRVTATVDRRVKGETPDAITFTLRGGVVGEESLHVSDQPSLLVGATYMLMLDGPDTEALILGGEQGAVRITAPGAFTGETLESAVKSLGACNE